jgi:transcriptional regulator with XRE-family HTH domain
MLSPEEIRRIRTEVLKLSQEQFAALLSVSAKTISRWENGEATPTGLYEEKLKKIKDVIDNPSLLNTLTSIIGSSLGTLGASFFLGSITNFMFLAKAGYSDKLIEIINKLLNDNRTDK